MAATPVMVGTLDPDSPPMGAMANAVADARQICYNA
jgi:hypothetical protein